MRLAVFISALLLSLSAAAQTDVDPRTQRRLVVLAPHLVESLFAIGAGDQIIATTDHSDYPAQASSIPRVGNYARLQIEQILALRPDAVVAWRSGNPADDLQRLEKYKINVVYPQADNLQDVASELRILGKLTGHEKQAEHIANDYLYRLHALKARYSKAEGVSVFYELWARPLRTVAGNSWLQQQIALCGGDNIYADIEEGYPQVSLENVLDLRPQVIFQPTTHGDNQPETINWQQWPEIPAVNHGFILHPDADKVHRMTTRMLDEVEVMCVQLDKARQFYAQDSDLTQP